MKSISLNYKSIFFFSFSILMQYCYFLNEKKLGNFDFLFQNLNPFWNRDLADSLDTEQ